MARVKPKTETAPDDDDILAGLEDLEDDVDSDDEDDEDLEDEEPVAKPQSARAKRAAARKKAAADDEDEDEEPAPARRSRKSKTAPAKKTATKRTPPAAKPLPTGKLSASDIAELVGGGCTGRDVRMYLRKKSVPVDADLGRYAFTKAQADKIAKAIKAARKG